MINIKKFVKNAIIEDNGRGDLFLMLLQKEDLLLEQFANQMEYLQVFNMQEY